MRFRKLIKASLCLAALLVCSRYGIAQSDPGASGAQSQAIQLTTSGDQPVNLFTGTANISVPLFSASGRSLSVPVALNYKATGIRVGQISSNVGLGWSLEAGGVITRIVKGNPDTYTCPSGNCVGNSTDEPDLYYFSVLGSSGRFYFGNGWTKSGGGAVPSILTLPVSQLRIEARSATTTGTVGDIDEFVITTEEGTRFVFGQNLAGYGDAKEKSKLIVNGTPKPVRVTAWYLTRIEASDFSDIILFSYENYTISPLYSYSAGKMRFKEGTPFFTTAAFATTITTPPAPAAPQPTGITNPCTQFTDGEVDVETGTTEITQGVRLKKIHFVHGTLEFLYGLSRCDIYGDQALTEIQLKRLDASVVNRVVLNYEYFLSPGSSTACVGTTHNNGARLKLLSVARPHSGGTLTTAFTYAAETLPPRDSKAQDHWGFSNGQTGNVYWAPPAAGKTLGANKTPSFPAMQAGTLTEIAYPTGSKTVFEYEAHQTSSGIAGGLRMKKMTVQPDGNPAAANNIVREFRYTTYTGGIAGAASSGVQVYRPGYSFKGYEIKSSTNASYRGAAEYTFQYWSSARTFGADAHVEYGTAAELRGIAGANGITITDFTTGASDPTAADLLNTSTYTGYGGVPSTVRDWKRGLAKQTRLYDMTTPAAPALVQQSTSTYVFDDDQATKRLFYTRSATGAPTTTASVGVTTNSYARSYALQTGWVYLAETNGLTPAQDGSGTTITSKSTYTYNNRQAVTETETFGSAGEVQGSTIRYSGDFTITSPTSEEALSLQLLQTQGRLNLPIEVLSYRRTAPATTRYIIGSSVTFLKRITINGVVAQGSHPGLSGSVVAAEKAFSLRLSQPLLSTSFTTSNITAGALQVDSRYEVAATLQGSVSQRNTFGQPLEVVATNGVKSSVVFGHKNTSVVASFSNAGLNQIAFSGFEEGTSSFGGWTYTADIANTTARTGSKGHNLTSKPISKSGIPTGTYWVSLWKNGGAAPTLAVTNGSVAVPTEQSYAGWELLTWKVTVSTTGNLTLSGTTTIDDVRLHPYGSFCSSTTADIFYGPTSQSGADNLPGFTIYDDIGRVVEVRDFEGNLIQHFEYKIKGQ